jgi:YfiR/HmsC-like
MSSQRRPTPTPVSAGRLLAVLLLSASSFAAAETESEKPTEYEVKSAFLFHFARLTEWPESALPAGEPFVVAVIGHDPFGAALDRVLEGEAVQGRPLVIRRAATLEALAERPHIVFVSAEASEAARILRHFRDQPVLTVGEMPGFGEMGGIVNFFVTGDGRVRFEINVHQSEAGGLRISSQVLKLARIVGGAP